MDLSWVGFQRRLLQWKWRKNAHPGELAIDWERVGYTRVALVNLLAAQFRECNYLEIGCGTDALFHAVNAAKKTGVDPLRGGTLRTTSDAFFAQNKERFDVVFIDGLHTYEQVHRDIAHALRVLTPGGWIAMHDMTPCNWREEHVPRLSSEWTGDCWKVAFELIEAKDVEFRILHIDHGVGVLRVTGPSPSLPGKLAELTPLRFKYYYENRAKLPIIDFPAARAWVLGQRIGHPSGESE